jgi:hypothetical protein
MSGAVPYDPTQFVVERFDGGDYYEVTLASLTYSSDYTIADHRTGKPPSHIPSLVVGTEQANISFSRWDNVLHGDPLHPDILYPLDKVRVSYAGHVLMLGTVESVAVSFTADPEAARHGAAYRIDYDCSVGGYYADLLTRTVTWSSLKQELWIERISHFVTVTGW